MVRLLPEIYLKAARNLSRFMGSNQSIRPHEMCDEEKDETAKGLPAHAMLQCLIDLGGKKGYGARKGNSHLTVEQSAEAFL
jgi:hypothetical protein